ncbi:MAG: DsrH/TusB family sulfur metabolism protein [Candidatus Bathyarchaeota archaeon]|nr:DsrH/TusB family sulfur metabolism protein [Candidatus Bathyarchaeota archaeon]
MSVLFVIGRFQEGGTAFRLAEEMARDGHMIRFLFTGEGCRHAVDRESMRSIDYAEVAHCLKSDCEAEGLLDKIADGVETIGYDGWVELIEDCEKIVSWL